MKSKFLLIVALITLNVLSLKVYSNPNEEEVVFKTKISEVTIFLTGAEVRRTGELTLQPGRQKIIFKGLSPVLDPQSITASFGNNIKILSITHKINYLENLKQEKRSEELQDSLEMLSYKKDKLAYELMALEEEKKLLIENGGRIGEKEGVKTVELTTAASFYRIRLNEIHNKMLDLQMSIRKLNTGIDKVRSQLGFVNQVSKIPTSEITVLVDIVSATKASADLKYLVKDAGWMAKYDIRAKGADAPIEFEYRAEAFNRTGENWENVKFVLSTGDPSKSMEKPTLDPWGLNYGSRYNYNQNDYNGNEGRLNTFQLKNDLSSISDTSDILSRISLSEIFVSELSVEFTIDDKYSIPADGNPYLLDVNAFKLNAAYSYFAIPKVDKDAFLIAKITGWEKLNLVAGPANIYLNNTFVGVSFINPENANDTLDFSLGRDKKVLISRVKKEDFNSKKLIGLNREESFAYEIDIRNTNSTPINIEIIDQVPISQESDIEVKVDEISNAVKDDQSGKLTWKMTLPPAETKKLSIAYSVKYPKSKQVVLRKSRKVMCPRFM